MNWLAGFLALASYIGMWMCWALVAFAAWFKVVRLWHASLPLTPAA